MDTEFNFGPAAEDELIVFGARRPEGLPSDVTRWINVMSKQGIQRVVCLLSGASLAPRSSRIDWISMKKSLTMTECFTRQSRIAD